VGWEVAWETKKIFDYPHMEISCTGREGGREGGEGGRRGGREGGREGGRKTPRASRLRPTSTLTPLPLSPSFPKRLE